MANLRIILLSLFIVGCTLSNNEQKTAESNKGVSTDYPINVAKNYATSRTTKIATNMVRESVMKQRINTTQCKDRDDWYLDGYRVGKSFRDHKYEMLEQRSQYCGYSLKTLPPQYKINWEQGFQVGTKR